jgi:RNA polymerase sporulation-specific sigma factor
MPLSLTEENDEEGQLDLPTESEEERITESMSLREALKDLPANDRKLVWFRYFQDQTQIETAQRLGMTQVQVSRREKKILTELRQMLG